MEERLSLLGGGGRWLNLFGAMKIGGFADPSIIFKAIRDGEIEINKELLCDGDPENKRSWIQIETTSFIRWLERRSQLDFAWVHGRFGDVLRFQARVDAKLGYLQRQIADTKVAVRQLKDEIEALAALIFENLRVTKSKRVGRVRPRRSI